MRPNHQYEQQVLPFDVQAIQHFATVLKQNLKRSIDFVPKPIPILVMQKKKELPPIPKLSSAHSTVRITSPSAIEQIFDDELVPEQQVTHLPIKRKIPKVFYFTEL